jgi:hypothetical protein
MMRGAVGERESGSGIEVEAGRQGHDHLGGYGDLLREGPQVDKRQHLVASLDV